MTEQRVPGDGAERGQSGCEAVFHERAALERGVRGLGRESVPADAIHVHVLDESGARIREVDVPKEAGTLRGALLGAAAGGLIGLVLVLLAAAGAFGELPLGSIGVPSVLAAAGAILTLAVSGLPLGAVLGLGHWTSRRRVSDEELAEGGVLVRVTNDELADTGRRVLREAGGELKGG